MQEKTHGILSVGPGGGWAASKESSRGWRGHEVAAGGTHFPLVAGAQGTGGEGEVSPSHHQGPSSLGLFWSPREVRAWLEEDHGVWMGWDREACQQLLGSLGHGDAVRTRGAAVGMQEVGGQGLLNEFSLKRFIRAGFGGSLCILSRQRGGLTRTGM